MHPIEKQLHKDHYHFSRLLRCLQRQVESLESDSRVENPLSLILDALDYIKVYPERWHHPVEDVIFAHIARSHPQHAKKIAAIHAEHQDLEQSTRDLDALFTAIANDTVVPMDRLMRDSREFLMRQLSHIDRENELTYPLMAECLSDGDWQELEAQIEAADDPLFGDNLRQEYMELLDYVLESEAHQQIQAAISQPARRI
ncbi:hypothetical protein HBA55_20750 [Pseudomaricurvus alkylphenolicus]|jgi:hemerythrin-like domain-containing protein|uniref:hemerythrin domain-containing protein n=1 Tax=Pseudomaricurvus alkylphenolicus TaxID=1306991 RepID=UPI001422E61A|nr:hemerythrin domain-containing protein [Pseudomaricurvus alkylphenolicus]NIB42047.1 hypothetical protein [Pseudomaricurvus alkylphenolicus]